MSSTITITIMTINKPVLIPEILKLIKIKPAAAIKLKIAVFESNEIFVNILETLKSQAKIKIFSRNL